MATNKFGNYIVEWHSRYKPLPPGYTVVQLNSGHFLWTLEHHTKNIEGQISWDKWWVRRCAFAHYKENQCSSN